MAKLDEESFGDMDDVGVEFIFRASLLTILAGLVIGRHYVGHVDGIMSALWTPFVGLVANIMSASNKVPLRGDEGGGRGAAARVFYTVALPFERKGITLSSLVSQRSREKG